MTVRLERDGVVLRPWEEGDLAAMAVLFDDPAVARYTPLPSPFTAERAAERLARARTGEPLLLAVTTDGSQPRGEVMLARSGTLGYALGAAHRGRGLASRALALLRDHAHATGHEVLRLEIEPDNTASAAVARRAGFVLVQLRHTTVQDKGRSVPLDLWEHR